MTDAEKIAKIDYYRQKFEQSLKAAYGVDATITVALHSPTFEQFAAGCALGWKAKMLDKSGTLFVASKPKPGDIGDTVLYYYAGNTH